MKRVLVLAPIFSPCSQSASQRISSFVQALTSERFESVVIAGNRCFGKGTEPLQGSDVLVYDLNCPRFLLSASFAIINPILLLLFFALSFVVGLRKRIDVVLASVPAGETFVAGFLFSKMFKASLIVDIRDMYPPPSDEMVYMPTPSKLNSVFVAFFKGLYRNSDTMVCVDPSVQRRLVAFGVPYRKTVVIPNGADASVYKPVGSQDREAVRAEYGLPLRKFIFVYAGALAWYYPVAEAVRGLKELPAGDGDVELLIISHVGYAYEKKLAGELGLEGMVRFMGPLPMADTARILSACDVGLVVYRGDDYWKDMYGGKIFSYMSCGLPILASGPNGSVIDELLGECKRGLFIGPPTSDGFAHGFSYFLKNKKVAKEMGESGRKTVEEFYDRRKLGLRLASLIDGLHE